MIFVGDLASPNRETSEQLNNFFIENSLLFNGKRLICNFEGLLNEDRIQQNEPVLHNHPSVLNVLKNSGEVFVGLANNHILDLPGNFDSTLRALNDHCILYSGAGKSLLEAEKPASFYENGSEVFIFNACWDFLLYNHKNPSNNVHVAVIDEEKLIKKISHTRLAKSEAVIIIYLHWNFDLEIIPFPMHRQFSKKLIDVGADLIIGAHSHCVQGGEKYKNGYIIYGLGNFFIPNGEFANGKLNFPTLSQIELVFEWNEKTKKAFCHWFEYLKIGNQHRLKYLDSDDFETCKRLKSYSVYEGMSEKKYLNFFKKTRRKRILVPIFRDYNNRRVNALYTCWLKSRARFTRILVKMNFHKWQN